MSPAEKALLEALLQELLKSFPSLGPAIILEEIKMWWAHNYSQQNPEQPGP